jgi:hypothetical protein
VITTSRDEITRRRLTLCFGTEPPAEWPAQVDDLMATWQASLGRATECRTRGLSRARNRLANTIEARVAQLLGLPTPTERGIMTITEFGAATSVDDNQMHDGEQRYSAALARLNFVDLETFVSELLHTSPSEVTDRDVNDFIRAARTNSNRAQALNPDTGGKLKMPVGPGGDGDWSETLQAMHLRGDHEHAVVIKWVDDTDDTSQIWFPTRQGQDPVEPLYYVQYDPSLGEPDVEDDEMLSPKGPGLDGQWAVLPAGTEWRYGRTIEMITRNLDLGEVASVFATIRSAMRQIHPPRFSDVFGGEADENKQDAIESAF